MCYSIQFTQVCVEDDAAEASSYVTCVACTAVVLALVLVQ